MARNDSAAVAASADYRGGGRGHARGRPACPHAYNSPSRRAAREGRRGDHEQGIHPRNRRPTDDDDAEAGPPLPAGARNYMTPGGFARLSAELERLVKKERPELVATVAWAASQRRSLGERRLHLRQEAPARDRPAHPLPDQAPRHRRGRRSAGDATTTGRPGVLRRDGHRSRSRAARSARSASSASTKSTPRAATSAGCRRWRARCSRRARATR